MFDDHSFLAALQPNLQELNSSARSGGFWLLLPQNADNIRTPTTQLLVGVFVT